MSPRGKAKSILITGCDSGVGLEVAKSLAAQARNSSDIAVVLAAAMNPHSAELDALAKSNSKVRTVQLDLKDYKNFGNFAKTVQAILNEAGVQHLSALVNSAALHYDATLKSVDADQMMKAFAINAVSPLMLIKAMASHLESAARSSGISTAGAGSGGFLFSSAKASSAVGYSGASSGMLRGAGAGGLHGGAGAGGLHGGAGAGGIHGGAGAGGLHGAAGAGGLHGASGAGGARGSPYGPSDARTEMGDYAGGRSGAAGADVGGDGTAHFGAGGANSGAILAGEPGLAYNGQGAGGLVLNLTSGLSSVSANGRGGFYAYRSSKAALNMITKSVAADLANTGILTFSLNIDNAALDDAASAGGVHGGSGGIHGGSGGIHGGSGGIHGGSGGMHGGSGGMHGGSGGMHGGAGGFSEEYSADRVAQTVVQLMNRGNAHMNGSLINVQGAPLLF